MAHDRFRNEEPSLSFMSAAEFEMRFLSSNELEITTTEGETTRYRRATPFAPTEADLSAFAGRYGSDELGTVFEIVRGAGGLEMRLAEEPGQAAELDPVDTDTFMLSRMVVRFVRDASGGVIGFDYSNPVVRNIEFTRLGDGPRGL